MGFPGETKEEWRESVDFISDIKFSHIHIFSYSAREGTKAAELPNQISTDVKKSRSIQLHQLAAKMKKSWLEKHIHRQFPVLWEGSAPTDKKNIMKYSGYTPNFIRTQIEVASDTVLTNKIHKAKINAVNINGESVLCELI